MSENSSQVEAVKKINEDAGKCFEFFFSQNYEQPEELKQQLWYLAEMAYVSFRHLKGEFEADARAMDAKTSSSTPRQESDTAQNGESDISEATAEEESTDSDSYIRGEDTQLSLTDGKLTQFTRTEGEESNMKSEVPGVKQETDSFVKKTLMAIKKVAPNLRYKPKHLRRKKFKVIPYEFASVWRNCSSIFSEEKSSSPSPSTQSIVPKVAWEKVNMAALKKLPAPTTFPVQTASPSPQFYNKTEGCPSGCPQYEAGRRRECSCRLGFDKPNPFGSLLGFKSNMGVVSVPSEPLFGHIWDTDTSSWILHAEIPVQESFRDERWRRDRRPAERGTRRRPTGRTRRRR